LNKYDTGDIARMDEDGYTMVGKVLRRMLVEEEAG